MKGVTILGSTGTIGVNTLDVISRHQDPSSLRLVNFKPVARIANVTLFYPHLQSNENAAFDRSQFVSII